MTSNKIAVIRIRGKSGMKRTALLTLDMLRLYRPNYCVVVNDTPSMRGMVMKVKDYVTFGTISDALFAELVEKRGEIFTGREGDSKGLIKYKSLEFNGKKYKPFFRLHPPVKGHGRKGIKLPFSQGGVLGDRADKIKDLIGRML